MPAMSTTSRPRRPICRRRVQSATSRTPSTRRVRLALALLRAVGWLSRDDLITRTGHAGPALETPGAQVLGDHRFRYSLFFHAGDWERAAVWRAAEAALVPMLPGRGPAVRTPAPGIE